jgi:hypothetical protein
LFVPQLEVLEDRRLLAQSLLGGSVLKETFDDIVLTSSAGYNPRQGLYSFPPQPPSSGGVPPKPPTTFDDPLATTVPASAGHGTTTTFDPSHVLFRHSVAANSGYLDVSLSTTTPTAADQVAAALELFTNSFSTGTLSSMTIDVITFPDVNPATDQVRIANIDVQKGLGATVTFVGMNDSETLSPDAASGTPSSGTPFPGPPGAIDPGGSASGGPIYVVDGGGNSAAPQGWVTLGATASDLGVHGVAMGPIVAIKLNVVYYGDFDNLRLFVSTTATHPAPHAHNDVYELPYYAGPGQTFTSQSIGPATPGGSPSVLDNDSTINEDSSGLLLPLHARLVTGPTHDPGFTLNPDGTFAYTPDSTFPGTDSFTYVANDGTGDSNVATVTIVTNGSSQDSDGDGVPDYVEVFAPNNGDGNSDGALDYLQANVASLLAADRQYWTLVTSTDVTQGQGFIHVDNETPASRGLPPIPPGYSLPAGLFHYQIPNLHPGDSAVVRLTPASGTDGADAFLAYDGRTNSWITFPFDPSTGLGADISSSDITLHLTDGASGDFDGMRDGKLTFVGGPVTGNFDPTQPPPVATQQAPSHFADFWAKGT